MIDNVLYDFLKNKIHEPYELRYPYQTAPIKLQNGYISWQFINSNIFSTQSFKKEYKNDVLHESIYQRFNSQYMLICEKEYTKDTKNALDLMSEINIYLNSYDFILFCKTRYQDIELLRITDSITNDIYFHDTKTWIAKSTMILNFIEKRLISVRDMEINNIKIKENHI